MVGFKQQGCLRASGARSDWCFGARLPTQSWLALLLRGSSQRDS
jgi:hypothetical protein